MASNTDALLRDEAIQRELGEVKLAIQTWAEQNELWFDAGFKIPFLHRNEAPREGEALLLCFDGPFHSMFSGGHEHWDRLEEQFRTLLESVGFEYELHDHVTACLYPKDDGAKADYLRLHRWHWVQHLAERRLFDLHAEVFEHFAQSPESLHDLHWRKYEEFLDAIFRNQGFRTELGPGSNDGGIDIRLYQSEAIPEIVTLVQARRYKSPIKLEAVAALTAIAQMERAPRALFATTSYYQPKARLFARNTETRLDLPTVELVDLQRTQEWCAEISKQLGDYFLTGEPAPPPIIRNRPATALTGKIVVASWGYNTSWNSFAVIEADFPHEVVLRPIGHHDVSGDGQRGTQMPDINRRPSDGETPRILAFKHDSKFGSDCFWGAQKLYSLWDGTPQHFDICD